MTCLSFPKRDGLLERKWKKFSNSTGNRSKKEAYIYSLDSVSPALKDQLYIIGTNLQINSLKEHNHKRIYRKRVHLKSTCSNYVYVPCQRLLCFWCWADSRWQREAVFSWLSWLFCLYKMRKKSGEALPQKQLWRVRASLTTEPSLLVLLSTLFCLGATCQLWRVYLAIERTGHRLKYNSIAGNCRHFNQSK